MWTEIIDPDWRVDWCKSLCEPHYEPIQIDEHEWIRKGEEDAGEWIEHHGDDNDVFRIEFMKDEGAYCGCCTKTEVHKASNISSLVMVNGQLTLYVEKLRWDDTCVEVEEGIGTDN